MRLIITLMLMGAATLYGASFLQSAKSAEAHSADLRTSHGNPWEAEAAKRRLKAEANQRDAADKRREERINRLTGSVCVGCGGPVVPFDPSGGEDARRAVSAGGGKARMGRAVNQPVERETAKPSP